MFTNYQNLSDYYIPNNLNKQIKTPQSYTKLERNKASKPYELYNIKNELEGYYWYEGEIFNLEFNIDGEITIESNSLIFNAPGECPNLLTEGRIGQKAYNISDLISWTCISIAVDNYIWEQDSEFIYPLGAEKSVFVSAKEYLKDKIIKATFYNFRLEEMFSKTFEGQSQIIISIDNELKDFFKKGIYYCSLEVSGSNTYQKLFGPQDCKLLVK
jgi:hypothetical protein